MNYASRHRMLLASFGCRNHNGSWNVLGVLMTKLSKNQLAELEMTKTGRGWYHTGSANLDPEIDHFESYPKNMDYFEGPFHTAKEARTDLIACLKTAQDKLKWALRNAKRIRIKR